MNNITLNISGAVRKLKMNWCRVRPTHQHHHRPNFVMCLRVLWNCLFHFVCVCVRVFRLVYVLLIFLSLLITFNNIIILLVLHFVSESFFNMQIELNISINHFPYGWNVKNFKYSIPNRTGWYVFYSLSLYSFASRSCYSIVVCFYSNLPIYSMYLHTAQFTVNFNCAHEIGLRWFCVPKKCFPFAIVRAYTFIKWYFSQIWR